MICGRFTWLCLQGQMMLFLFQKDFLLVTELEYLSHRIPPVLTCDIYKPAAESQQDRDGWESRTWTCVVSQDAKKRLLSLETTNRQMYRISTWDGCSNMIDTWGVVVIGYLARISYNLYTLRPEDQPRLWCLLDSLMIASTWHVECGNKDFMEQQWLFCFGNDGAPTFTLMQPAYYIGHDYLDLLDRWHHLRFIRDYIHTEYKSAIMMTWLKDGEQQWDNQQRSTTCYQVSLSKLTIADMNPTHAHDTDSCQATASPIITIITTTPPAYAPDLMSIACLQRDPILKWKQQFTPIQLGSLDDIEWGLLVWSCKVCLYRMSNQWRIIFVISIIGWFLMQKHTWMISLQEIIYAR